VFRWADTRRLARVSRETSCGRAFSSGLKRNCRADRSSTGGGCCVGDSADGSAPHCPVPRNVGGPRGWPVSRGIAGIGQIHPQNLSTCFVCAGRKACWPCLLPHRRDRVPPIMKATGLPFEKAMVLSPGGHVSRLGYALLVLENVRLERVHQGSAGGSGGCFAGPYPAKYPPAAVSHSHVVGTRKRKLRAQKRPTPAPTGSGTSSQTPRCF